MKVFNNQQILSLSFKQQGHDSARLFSELKIGEKISAGIIAIRGNSAELEINGKRITADFARGVPQGKTVDLILTEKTPDRIVFSIAAKQTINEMIKLLSPFSVISDNKFGDLQLHSLVKFLNTAKPDLLSINLHLTGISKDEKFGKNRTELFNNLLGKGLSFSTLSELSFITGGKMGEILFTFYSLIKPEKKKAFQFKDEQPDEKADNILRELLSDSEYFSEVADLIFHETNSKDQYGEIPFPDGDAFTRLEYIQEGDTFFIDFELTNLGKISTIIRTDKYGTFINIFSDNDNSISYLKERLSLLEKHLDLMDVKKPVISLYNSKKMIDKIDAWSTDFYIKRDFDVKI